MSELEKFSLSELCVGLGLCLVGVWLGEEPSELNEEARLCRLRDLDSLEFSRDRRVTCCWPGEGGSEEERIRIAT